MNSGAPTVRSNSSSMMRYAKQEGTKEAGKKIHPPTPPGGLAPFPPDRSGQALWAVLISIYKSPSGDLGAYF